MTIRKRKVLATLALLGGCYGTSTGNPNGGSSDEGPDVGGPGIGGPRDPSEGPALGGQGCRKAGEREIADGEPTDLGFTAGDVALLLSSRSEILHWAPARLGEYGPETGEQTLALGLVRKSGPARLVDYQEDFGGTAIAANCPDAIEIDVTATVTSAQGALNERFDTTIRAYTKELVHLHKTFKPAVLGGKLRFTSLPEQSTVASYTLISAITPYGSTGRFYATIERPASGGTTTGSWSGDIATWGFGPCDDGVGVPLEAVVDGTSGADLLALVRDNAAAQLSWQDGATTGLTLAFEPTQSGVCAVLAEDRHALEGRKGTLLMRGTLVATSADQHVRARWPVELAGRPNQGVIDKITIGLDHRVSRTDPSLERDFGLYDFDVAQYDSFGVNVRFELTTGGRWSGELNVTGFDHPDCAIQQMRDADGKLIGETNGCPPATQRPVARGTLSD